jgi:hypothetical protein
MRVLAGTVVAIAGVILAAGCGSTGTAAPRTTSAGPSRPATRAQQIARARASNDLLSIFPTKTGTKRCGIPEGGVHFGPLPGTCTTRVRYPVNHGPEQILVSFTEGWCPRGDDCVVATQRHTWTVAEIQWPGAKLRVYTPRQRGSTAPQYYK